MSRPSTFSLSTRSSIICPSVTGEPASRPVLLNALVLGLSIMDQASTGKGSKRHLNSARLLPSCWSATRKDFLLHGFPSLPAGMFCLHRSRNKSTEQAGRLRFRCMLRLHRQVIGWVGGKHARLEQDSSRPCWPTTAHFSSKRGWPLVTKASTSAQPRQRIVKLPRFCIERTAGHTVILQRKTALESRDNDWSFLQPRLHSYLIAPCSQRPQMP